MLFNNLNLCNSLFPGDTATLYGCKQRDYMLWVLVIGGIPTVLSMTMANLIRSIGNDTV